MSAQLTQLVEELADPDVAWMWRNDRPGPITEYSVPPMFYNRPSQDTTVFFPSADVRGFYLPAANHWDLLSEMLQLTSAVQCEWRTIAAEPP